MGAGPGAGAWSYGRVFLKVSGSLDTGRNDGGKYALRVEYMKSTLQRNDLPGDQAHFEYSSNAVSAFQHHF